jgi:hypothetical protein
MITEPAHYKMIKVDSKGRISLGKLAEAGVSSYKAHLDKETNQIILEPYAEIPLKESWLFKNKAAFKKVHNGIMQSGNGKTKYIGGFSQYIQEEQE